MGENLFLVNFWDHGRTWCQNLLLVNFCYDREVHQKEPYGDFMEELCAKIDF
jgi:hypothetical protein